MGLPELLILIVVLVGGSLWVWMIIDCATHEPSGTDKIVWILVILLGSCVGALIYLLVRRSNRIAQLGQ
jgi:hypothetical protein